MTNTPTLTVRNATPELFHALKSLDGDHGRRMREVEAQMRDQFNARCQKIAA